MNFSELLVVGSLAVCCLVIRVFGGKCVCVCVCTSLSWLEGICFSN